MRLQPRLHDVYVGRTVLRMVLAAWGVLLGLDVVLALSGELKHIGTGSYSVGHAISWVAYTLPRRAYTSFPMAAVIGSLLGLGQLAASSELTALRALGLSRRRLAASVAIALSLLTALMVFSGETLGPWGQAKADNLRNSARTDGAMATVRYSGIWAREGDTFLNARSGEEDADGADLVLNEVRLYRTDASNHLVEMVYAPSLRHADGQWTLVKPAFFTFHERSVDRRFAEAEVWDSQLDPGVLASGLARPRNLSGAELRSSIEYRKRNGLDARDYEDNYWSRWFYPLNVLALCLAAVPFAFGSLRSGGMGKRLFLGMLFALAFWLLQMFFGRMAGALRFDYRIAYALPPIVMLAVSGWLFRRKVG